MAQTFDPEPSSVRHARRFVADALEELGATVHSERASLLASELTTNAVLHARTPITVEVSVGASIRISVYDSSAEMPALRSLSELAGTGRGLHLVEALAAAWGVERTGAGGGKAVWFELARDDDAPPGAQRVLGAS